ncbi:hypothetical protein KACC15558_13580 [Brevibacterium ammoniilyticum]|uniref:Swt1-like HEPN domain-containing protein n=1 Tax=Brevibacterium ammoniilyticum TaxID=1046555 RepID=A0ABP9TYG1_9MICO
MTENISLQAFFFRSMAVNRQLNAEDPGPTQQTIDSFSPDARDQAGAMGKVYELLYCLENSIRELVESTLREAYGPQDWWIKGVDEMIRKGADKRAADDAKARWHSPRGNSQLAYVDFPQYGEIILSRWDLFEPLLGDQTWVTAYFAELNRTRRALAHTGRLTGADVERMDIRVRDWLRVVG